MEHTEYHQYRTEYGGLGDMVLSTKENISYLREYIDNNLYEINKKLAYIIRLLEVNGFKDNEQIAMAKKMHEDYVKIMQEYKVKENE